MTTNGNGHTSPAVIEANKRVEACRKRLEAIDGKLTGLRTQHEHACTTAMLAKEHLDTIDPTQREWRAAHEACEQAEAHRDWLQRKLDEQVRLRALPAAEYEEASQALSVAIQAEDLERAKREEATALHAWDQTKQAEALAAVRYGKARQARFDMERAQREALQQQNMQTSHAQFKKANPQGTPGFERVRHAQL